VQASKDSNGLCNAGMAFLLTSAITASTCGLARGFEWRQWRGAERDGKSKESGLLKSWPEEGPPLLWSVGGLGAGFSSVSVADGFIYTTGLVGKEGVLSAIGLEGNLRWQKVYGEGWSGSHSGTRTTATVDEGSVYVVSGHGKVVCFDARSGELQWEVDALARFGGMEVEWGISESPLICEDKVICTPGGEAGCVVALDKRTGKTVWTSKGLGDKHGYCSPILVEWAGRKVIVTVTARAIVGLDAATGEVLWQHQNKLHKGEPRRVNPNTPLYCEGEIYVTSRWVGGVKLRMSEDGRSVRQEWSDTVFDPHHGGAVLVDGYIYGASSKDKWMCLDWATGEVMYEKKWIGKGSVIYADGMLYCYEEKKGTVGLVRATPKGFEVVSSFEVSLGSGPHWSHPVICGGRLYIRHGEMLMAYDIRER